jgi:hypothetical protein
MKRYFRVEPEFISIEAPRHRFINYIHYLSYREGTGENEYINRICWEKTKTRPFTKEDEAEALEALKFLVECRLVKVVE